MRNRMIKPEFWRSETVAGLVDPWARLLFIGLWNYADDDGREKADPVLVRASIFPREDFTVGQVGGWLDDLERVRLIGRWTEGGTTWMQIRNFAEHQVINKRSIGRCPAPPVDLFDTTPTLVYPQVTGDSSALLFTEHSVTVPVVDNRIETLESPQVAAESDRSDRPQPEGSGSGVVYKIKNRRKKDIPPYPPDSPATAPGQGGGQTLSKTKLAEIVATKAAETEERLHPGQIRSRKSWIAAKTSELLMSHGARFAQFLGSWDGQGDPGAAFVDWDGATAATANLRALAFSLVDSRARIDDPDGSIGLHLETELTDAGCDQTLIDEAMDRFRNHACHLARPKLSAVKDRP